MGMAICQQRGLGLRAVAGQGSAGREAAGGVAGPSPAIAELSGTSQPRRSRAHCADPSFLCRALDAWRVARDPQSQSSLGVGVVSCFQHRGLEAPGVGSAGYTWTSHSVFNRVQLVPAEFSWSDGID